MYSNYGKNVQKEMEHTETHRFGQLMEGTILRDSLSQNESQNQRSASNTNSRFEQKIMHSDINTAPKALNHQRVESELSMQHIL